MRRGNILILLTIFMLLFVAACSNDKENIETTSDPNKEPQTETEKEEQEKPKEPEKIEKEITISAIGDMLIHSQVYKDAKVAGGYDFTPMLDAVKPFLNSSTITIANQETMIGGESIGLSSYPRFNSPVEVGDALKDAGVDVVSIANNHTLDHGEEAIQQAIQHWETIDMMYTGAYRDQEDSNDIRVYETQEGISVAFLAYTYGTNGIPVPDGKDYLVNLIDRDNMAGAIEEAESKADVTILSLHFGNEYERLPSEEQKDLVQFAADHGVEVVLGHHPHVLQPVDWVEGESGNKTLVAYSLGNFLSGQDEFYRRIGGIMKFTIHKTIVGEEETIDVTSPKFVPTFVTYQDWRDYGVIPMYQLTNEQLPNAQEHYEEIKAHMSQWMPELEFIEK
ncbi:CapA family protein [Virgibacillus oceani]|uniref:Capsular polysaccharide biosynthesis protein n=1 Tax=Virgibacillus oceani TaxID=1479511 RepID=A0A917HTI4_9BACI|nr:CapA family protein [Virgibacillus oceani]GGG88844.1 capsular polysaccharide biosynthesis protein [Virgibacillus oceani]